MAGLSALPGAGDAIRTESRLKSLLAQQPQESGARSAALHLVLGNHYAAQSRWGDAQQSYFNAYKLEPGNAQTAFNLAVSLDHLQQGKLAAQYYQQALQLDASNHAGFDHAQAQQRINELLAR
jgi:tetratricopeptide (TPR) repeat protein